MRTQHMLSAAAVVLAAGAASAEDQPNILFIFTDDHAAHAISAYGSVINQTPNIDRIADEGVLFTNCFCTNSICAPSRAVILTGKHSHLNGVPTNREEFDGSQQTFPKLLQRAGYDTAIVGKWHLKSDPTGFDHYEVLLGQGPYYNPQLKTPDGVIRHTGYTTDILTDRALQWLRDSRDPDKPFLLMFQHKAPHRNWMPDPAHFRMYDDADIPEPATLFDDYEGRNSGAGTQEMSIANHMFGMYDLKLGVQFDGMKADWEKGFLDDLTPEQRDAWDAFYGPRNEAFREAYEAGEFSPDELTSFKYQRYIKDYLRVIASVDDNIGRVLDYLDESGLADNTVVIYSSDQGFYLGDHGWYDKRWMYETSLRMPFIVRWPEGVEPGAVDDHMIQNLDFAPTFLDLAGAPIPDDMQGESILPLLEGRSPRWRDSIYYHYYESDGPHNVPKHYGVRTDRYKLIHYYELGEWELFDLQQDPDEMRSVYDEPAYAAIRARLEAELTRLQKLYGDTKPTAPIGSILQEPLRARAAAATLTRVLHADSPQDAAGADFDPAASAVHVGARITPRSPDGVIVAQGGGTYGYSLYLRQARPCFAVRNEGALWEITAPDAVPMGEPVHLIGSLDHLGYIHLYINGEHAGAAQAQIIASRPAEPLCIGFDSGGAVGSYEGENRFQGSMTDIRAYTGVITVDDIQEWVGD